MDQKIVLAGTTFRIEAKIYDSSGVLIPPARVASVSRTVQKLLSFSSESSYKIDSTIEFQAPLVVADVIQDGATFGYNLSDDAPPTVVPALDGSIAVAQNFLVVYQVVTNDAQPETYLYKARIIANPSSFGYDSSA